MRQKNDNIQNDRNFCSLKRKILSGGIGLTVFLVLFLLLNWAGSHYLMQRQQRLLLVQQQYSSLVYGLQETNSVLYSYAQTGNDETAQKCRYVMSQTEEASKSLASLLENPVFTDQQFMVLSYLESCEQLLNSEGNTGQLLALYQEASGHFALFQPLLETYNIEINTLREAGQREVELLQRALGSVMLFGCLIFLFVCILGIAGFSSKLTARIESFTAQAEKISKGDWNVTFEDAPYVRDEVDVLSRAFRRMLSVIQEQFEQLKKQEVIERGLKEAELKAANIQVRLERAQLRILQSRVNPHFLFNTLNVIAGQAAKEQALTTMDMLLNTADYLRYSLNKLDKIVTLQEEMQNVENYFQIQKRRFADRISFQVSWEEACAEVHIPSMIVQPLCENALLHGVMPLTQGGIIKVTAMCGNPSVEGSIRADTNLAECGNEPVPATAPTDRTGLFPTEPKKGAVPLVFLSVEDNGVGCEPKCLEEIRQNLLKQEYDNMQGIGLSNVIQRMQAFFHENLRWEISSTVNQGTRVTLIFPADPGSEGGNRDDGEADKTQSSARG